MAANCPHWNSGRCVAPGFERECPWSKPGVDYRDCTVAKAAAARAAGGGMEDQLRAAGAIADGDRVVNIGSQAPSAAAAMTFCDLCGKSVTEVTGVPLARVQAVVRDGFNPFSSPLLDMSLARRTGSQGGMSEEQMFQAWRKMVMADTTDWSLCFNCLLAFAASEA